MSINRRTSLAVVLGMLAIGVLLSSFSYKNFNKIALKMVSKSAKNGFTTKIEGEIYYSANGKMITYFTYPAAYITIANDKGEFLFYDQEKNTVFQSQNAALSSETSFFYFFLNNKKTDLGLSDMGFHISNTSFEEGLIVTDWAPPIQIASELGEIKLVHDRNDPIFMSYKDSKGMIIKKVYYYDYINMSGIAIPTSVTQIDYHSPIDSIITKISYSNVRMDNEVDDKLLNYDIPETAKVITQEDSQKK
jgi:hypothetical protein